MNDLLNKYNDYKTLVGCTLVYKLDDGSTIKVTFKENNFLHLLGLHKLLDIQIIQFWQDKNNFSVKNSDAIKEIRECRLTDTIIRSSHFFKLIEDRYNSFSYETLTTLPYTNAIINFNPSLIPSKLTSDYLLFEMDKNKEYNHMAIGINAKTHERYLETFFHEKTDIYVRNQSIVKVCSYELLDSSNNVIFEDRF